MELLPPERRASWKHRRAKQGLSTLGRHPPVRHVLLPHQPLGGRLHGPTAALAPRDSLRVPRVGRLLARPGQGLTHICLRWSHERRLRRHPSTRPRDAGHVPRHRDAPEHSVEPRLVLFRPQRRVHDDRHRLLQLVGGLTSGRTEPTPWPVRYGHRRRRKPDPRPGDVRGRIEATHAVPGLAVANVGRGRERVRPRRGLRGRCA